MINPSAASGRTIRFSIAIKLGLLLAVFGVLAIGLTAYYSYHETRKILVGKASNDLLQSTRILGQRFTSDANEITKDVLLFAQTPDTLDAFGRNRYAGIARREMTEHFISLLAEHPEYFQIRLISAQDNGIELVRVDRDGDDLKVVSGLDLQEKMQYPYVYKALKLAAGQVYFSSIFINREVGAHSGLNQPTLQVSSPVVETSGKVLGVIVINVDLNWMFAQLKADLPGGYQLYLTNEAGDFLVHPDSTKTFGFNFGRRFLVQDTFKPVSKIIDGKSDAVAVLAGASSGTDEVVGGFARVPFGKRPEPGSVIIGMTVPLDTVLAETDALSRNSKRIVIGFSLLAILLSSLVAVFFARPLKRLVEAVQRFSETRQPTPVRMGRRDELGLLAHSISEMQEHVLDYLNNLDAQNRALQKEIGERERIERFEQFRSRTLELIAGGGGLPDILASIVRGVEQLNPLMNCTISLLDHAGRHLMRGIGPSLPESYIAAMEGLEIGPEAASCGTAAYTGKRVIVEDVRTHPWWAAYRELAAQAGIVSCWSQPVFSSSGKVLGTLTIHHREAYTPAESDIHLVEQSASLAGIAIEHKQTEERVLQLALYDPLTDLPNRRTLMDRLHQALASSSRSGKPGALLFIDLDNFKILNDTLGHDMGDLLLQQVAHRLVSCVREDDTVSRLGGDEFVVILEDLSKHPAEAAAQAEAISEKMLAALNQPYQLAGHKLRSTPSIGITLFSDHKAGVEELLKQADIAMYQAKKAGRNAFRFFDPHMQDIINSRAALENELRNALNRHEFQLHYQIQVDSAQHPLGAEALIRWLHPEGGLLSPLQFISLAEETGLIIPIGQWVLETACAQLASWQHEDTPRNLVLAINVSAKQFRHVDFVAHVQATVQHHAIDPKQLKLELTESLLLDNFDDTVATMNALNRIGVQFSLDDFGTGYSSLQYLKLLPLNQLKIDRSFISNIATDSSDKAIVRTIIAMADSLELDTIAEGVETEAQQKILLDYGCTQFQGYLFGEPMPIAQFEKLLEQMMQAPPVYSSAC